MFLCDAPNLVGSLSSAVVVTIAESAVRAVVLLLCTAFFAWMLRRQSAALRHSVWLSATVVLLVLPYALWLLPGLHVLPHWGKVADHVNARVERPTRPLADIGTTIDTSSVITNSSVTMENPFADPVERSVASDAAETDATTRQPEGSLVKRDELPEQHAAVVTGFDTAKRSSALSAVTWSRWILITWLAGALILVVRLWASCFTLHRLSNSVSSIQAGPLFELKESIRSQLGVQRSVHLLMSRNLSMPMAWGVYRCYIHLPAEATQWNRGRLRSVLMHEMSHIARRDPLFQWMAQLATCIYWFHPLVWLAHRWLRVERERACDDMVVSNGVAATDYAEHLLRITAGPVHGFSCATALSMVRPHRLEGRLVAILGLHVNRQQPRVRALVTCVGLIVCLAIPLATLRAQSDNKRLSSTPTAQSTKSLVRLGYVDDTAEGKRSIAGSGHAISFARPAHARHLMAVEMFASRYGYPDAPAEDFHLYLLDEKFRLIQAIPFPYEMIERGESRWYTLKIPATKVPKKFVVALSFNPHQTKGVYLGLDKSVKHSHSLTGRVTTGYTKVPDRFDWMVRAVLVDKVPTDSPFDVPVSERQP